MKTIHVVGNAFSIFSSQYGELIDTGDYVIRFNLGVKDLDRLSQGLKTDLLVFSSPDSDIARKYYETNKYGKYTNTEKWHTCDFPEKNQLMKILGSKPSNGTVILEILKNKYPDACVRIFGFDWKKTRTTYRKNEKPNQAWIKSDKPLKERLRKGEHNYKKEKQYCKKLIRENNWELYQ